MQTASLTRACSEERTLSFQSCTRCTADGKMKDKPNSVRVYDADGYRLRAACICFKNSSKQEVLLVASSGAAGHWVVPGGGIEPDEDHMLAAVREAQEEAGVIGRDVCFIGNVKDDVKRTNTAVFSLIVEQLLDHYYDLHDSKRERRWFPVPEAWQLLRLHKQALAAYLENTYLGSGGDASDMKAR